LQSSFNYSNHRAGSEYVDDFAGLRFFQHAEKNNSNHCPVGLSVVACD